MLREPAVVSKGRYWKPSWGAPEVARSFFLRVRRQKIFFKKIILKNNFIENIFRRKFFYIKINGVLVY
jgi:hypothetical protein